MAKEVEEIILDPEGEDKHTSFYDNLLMDEFEKETDRGAVIVATSLFDSVLHNLLKAFLLPESNSKDELFEGPNAPLSSFNSKITLAFRLGLISQKFARDIHLIRKIRNEFAHNIHGCDFSHSSVKSRVLELMKSSEIKKKLPSACDTDKKGIRSDFLITCSWMIWALNSNLRYLKQVENCSEEFGYSDINEKELFEKDGGFKDE